MCIRSQLKKERGGFACMRFHMWGENFQSRQEIAKEPAFCLTYYPFVQLLHVALEPLALLAKVCKILLGHILNVDDCQDVTCGYSSVYQG